MYPVGTGTEEDFRARWYIALGFGEKQPYGFHEGWDINLKTGGDTDLGEAIKAIADYKLVYYHFNSHLESGFGVHYVYEVETPNGKRWIHCAHNQTNPQIATKKEGAKGDILSLIGKTGRPKTILPAHLHFACFKIDPAGLPSKIDSIAKTTKQLNDWWEDPQETINSLLKEENMPEWFDNFLKENNLTLNDEGKIRAIFGKAKDYDDKVKELTEQVKSANETLSSKSAEVSLLVDKITNLENKVLELEEQFNQARSERDKATWEKEKLEIYVKKLEEENVNFKEKNDIMAYGFYEVIFAFEAGVKRNMGLKLLWTGVAIKLGLSQLIGFPGLDLVGAIFLLIGIILFWLDK